METSRSILHSSVPVGGNRLDPEALVGDAWGHLVAALGTADRYPGGHKGLDQHQPLDPSLCTLPWQRPFHLSRQQDGSTEGPTSI